MTITRKSSSLNEAFTFVGNSCRPIQFVIILVINKSDSRFAVVRFCWIQTELDSTQSYYLYHYELYDTMSNY